MYVALLFDVAAFPGPANVRMWLAAQAGDKAKALGDLAIRGKYSIASAKHGKAHFVFRFADAKSGDVPNIRKLGAGVDLEQGVKAYEAPAE